MIVAPLLLIALAAAQAELSAATGVQAVSVGAGGETQHHEAHDSTHQKHHKHHHKHSQEEAVIDAKRLERRQHQERQRLEHLRALHEAQVQKQTTWLAEHTPEETVFAEIMSNPSPFNESLLVVLQPHTHNFALLDAAYRRHFWDVLYVAPQGTNKEIRDLSERGYAVMPCSKYAPLSTAKTLLGLEHRFDGSYPCVGEALGLLQEPLTPGKPVPAWVSRLKPVGADRPAPRGVLALNADFWITPAFLVDAVGFDHTKLWRAANEADGLFCSGCDGLVSWEQRRSCRSSSSAQHWDWWSSEQIALRKRAFADLEGAFGQASLGHVAALSQDEGRRCHAWSDMYYVPRKAWSAWSRVTKTIGDASLYDRETGTKGSSMLMHEIAIPLAFEVMGKLGGCTREGGGCEVESISCWGSSVDETDSPDVLASTSCGNKLSFKSARLGLKQGFMRLWGAKMPSADASPHIVVRDAAPGALAVRSPQQSSPAAMILAVLGCVLAIVVAIMYRARAEPKDVTAPTLDELDASCWSSLRHRVDVLLGRPERVFTAHAAHGQ